MSAAAAAIAPDFAAAACPACLPDDAYAWAFNDIGLAWRVHAERDAAAAQAGPGLTFPAWEG